MTPENPYDPYEPTAVRFFGPRPHGFRLDIAAPEWIEEPEPEWVGGKRVDLNDWAKGGPVYTGRLTTPSGTVKWELLYEPSMNQAAPEAYDGVAVAVVQCLILTGPAGAVNWHASPASAFKDVLTHGMDRYYRRGFFLIDSDEVTQPPWNSQQWIRADIADWLRVQLGAKGDFWRQASDPGGTFEFPSWNAARSSLRSLGTLGILEERGLLGKFSEQLWLWFDVTAPSLREEQPEGIAISLEHQEPGATSLRDDLITMISFDGLKKYLMPEFYMKLASIDPINHYMKLLEH